MRTLFIFIAPISIRTTSGFPRTLLTALLQTSACRNLHGHTLTYDNPEECAGQPSWNDKSTGSSSETKSLLALCTQSSWKWARTGGSLCALRHQNHAMIVPPAWFSRVLELSVSAFICWTQKFLLPGLWQRKHTNLSTSFFMTALPVHRPFLSHPVKK